MLQTLRPSLLAVAILASSTQAHSMDLIYNSSFEACTSMSSTGTVMQWSAAMGMAWPAYNQLARIGPTPNNYIAFSFTAGSAGQFGAIPAVSFPGSGGLAQLSISSAPGCFNASELGPNCVSTLTDIPTLEWQVGPAFQRCELQPGQSYYVNLAIYDCGQNGFCLRDLGNVQM